MAGPDVAEGFGCFVEGVGAVDDRRDGQHARFDDPTEGAEPAAAASAVGDEGAAWAINLAVAERQIRKRPRRGTPAAPVQVPLP